GLFGGIGGGMAYAAYQQAMQQQKQQPAHPKPAQPPFKQKWPVFRGCRGGYNYTPNRGNRANRPIIIVRHKVLFIFDKPPTGWNLVMELKHGHGILAPKPSD